MNREDEKWMKGQRWMKYYSQFSQKKEKNIHAMNEIEHVSVKCNMRKNGKNEKWKSFIRMMISQM